MDSKRKKKSAESLPSVEDDFAELAVTSSKKKKSKKKGSVENLQEASAQGSKSQAKFRDADESDAETKPKDGSFTTKTEHLTATGNRVPFLICSVLMKFRYSLIP